MVVMLRCYQNSIKALSIFKFQQIGQIIFGDYSELKITNKRSNILFTKKGLWNMDQDKATICNMVNDIYEQCVIDYLMVIVKDAYCQQNPEAYRQRFFAAPAEVPLQTGQSS